MNTTSDTNILPVSCFPLLPIQQICPNTCSIEIINCYQVFPVGENASDTDMTTCVEGQRQLTSLSGFSGHRPGVHMRKQLICKQLRCASLMLTYQVLLSNSPEYERQPASNKTPARLHRMVPVVESSRKINWIWYFWSKSCHPK